MLILNHVLFQKQHQSTNKKKKMMFTHLKGSREVIDLLVEELAISQFQKADDTQHNQQPGFLRGMKILFLSMFRRFDKQNKSS